MSVWEKREFDMASILEQLKDKREHIQRLKNKKAKLEGQKEQLLSQLKDKFGLSSIEEAEAKLSELEKKRDEYKSRLVELDKKMSEIIGEAERKRA